MGPNTIVRRLLLAACIALAVATTAAAQSNSHSWIRGVWDGTGYQIDDQSTWAMTLTARGRIFSINYPSLSCGGAWKLIFIKASPARVREGLDRGQGEFARKGQVIVHRRNRKPILVLY